MTLAAGIKLGSYEVLAPIGAGGMGEVYQAHDTKLGRDVATDGQRFLVNNPPEQSTSVPITVVVNWTARLKK